MQGDNIEINERKRGSEEKASVIFEPFLWLPKRDLTRLPKIT